MRGGDDVRWQNDGGEGGGEEWVERAWLPVLGSRGRCRQARQETRRLHAGKGKGWARVLWPRNAISAPALLAGRRVSADSTLGRRRSAATIAIIGCPPVAPANGSSQPPEIPYTTAPSAHRHPRAELLLPCRSDAPTARGDVQIRLLLPLRPSPPACTCGLPRRRDAGVSPHVAQEPSPR